MRGQKLIVSDIATKTGRLIPERHRSQPYNPNIANGFFRAGHVETWGRGIEKICETCKKHGVPLLEYKIHLEDIMVKFTPLMSAKVPEEQNGTLSGTLEEKGIIERIGGRKSGQWIEK